MGYQIQKNLKSENVFGFDHSGDLSNSQPREMNLGVPSYMLTGSIPFIENIEIYNLKFIHENLYILESDDFDIKKYKVYSLRPSLAGLIEITKDIFDKKDFEAELATGGMDSVMEFLCNEVLPDFGLEQYINKDEFFSNFVGSKMFKIIHEVSKDDPSKIPNRILNVNIPSPNGSLSRLITFYEELTGEKILNSRKFLNPEILKIRNEYPESFSLILTEKMIESYDNLYNSKEKEEIRKQYIKAAEIEDRVLLKNKLISLMCYWGYSSLVNVIANFSFVMDEKNYLSLKRIEKTHPAFAFYVDSFPKILRSINKVVGQYSSLSKFLEFPVEKFIVDDLNDIVIRFGLSLVYNTYGNQSPFYNISLNRLKFNNSLLGLLKDDNFCESLSQELKNYPILNTLPINYQNRGKIIAMLNDLSISWIEANESNIDLDSNKILERLPENIERPKKKVDELLGCSLKPNFVYHHGLFERGYTSKFDNKRIVIRCGTVNYYMNLNLAKLSDKEVPILNYHNFKRPITDEFLEGEIFEELLYLIKTGDYCQEEVEELLSEQKIQYKVPETKVIKGKGDFKKVYGDIKFIFIPAGENKNYINFVRQVGENVVLVSETYLLRYNDLYNSHTRLVNINGSELIFHITCNKALNKEFWDKFIGGDLIHIDDGVMDILCAKLVINDDGEIIDINESGTSFLEIFDTKGVKTDELGGLIEDSEYVRDVEAEEEKDIKCEKQSSNILDNNLEKLNKYIDALDNAVEEGKLVKENSEFIKNKLKDLCGTNVEMDNDYYLKQMLTELGLGNIKKLLSNELFTNISKEEKVKIFQAPTAFGLSRPGQQMSKNVIKDKGLKAELYSLNENLINACLSGTITISKEMKLLAKSSFKIWLNMIKDCNSFIENKKFFIIIFLTFLNDSNVSDNDDFDQDWQSLINCIQNFMVFGEDDLENDIDLLKLNIMPFSTMKYHISGM